MYETKEDIILSKLKHSKTDYEKSLHAYESDPFIAQSK
jgi:hypothetical protein